MPQCARSASVSCGGVISARARRSGNRARRRPRCASDSAAPAGLGPCRWCVGDRDVDPGRPSRADAAGRLTGLDGQQAVCAPRPAVAHMVASDVQRVGESIRSGHRAGHVSPGGARLLAVLDWTVSVMVSRHSGWLRPRSGRPRRHRRRRPGSSGGSPRRGRGCPCARRAPAGPRSFAPWALPLLPLLMKDWTTAQSEFYRIRRHEHGPVDAREAPALPGSRTPPRAEPGHERPVAARGGVRGPSAAEWKAR